MRLCIALDLGATKIAGALIDSSARIICEKRVPTDAARGPDAVVADLVALAVQLMHEARTLGSSLEGVGIGSAGQVDHESGNVVSATPNLPGFSGTPLGRLLDDAIGLEVHVDNDANAAALGAVWAGAGRGCRDLVCITLGTGVGGGIVSNGRLVRGIRGCGGELGHMSIAFEGPKCNCGSRGCLESYVSAWAITARARDMARSSGAFEWAADVDQITVKELFDAAKAGDEDAQDLADEIGLYLGFGAANIANVVAPEKILFAGGVSQAGETLLSPVRRGFRERALPPLRDAVCIAPAALGEAAVMVGAAALVWQRK